MKAVNNRRRALLCWAALVLALVLGGGCVPESPLGMVVVGPGEEIHIRSLEVLTGIGVRGIPRQRAVADGETLYIDRARLREALSGTRGFRGLIREISCDRFGDCGTGRAYVLRHTDATVTEIRALPVVYEYEP